MTVDHKIIRDPIHGDIRLGGMFLELIESPELQRLYSIKQLGFAHLVFPGAHHTRLEHSLGSFYIGLQTARQLHLKNNEKNILSCAALLHDVGHGPFSHTLESILKETVNVDHIDLTEQILLGKCNIYNATEEEYIASSDIYQILCKNDVEPKEIAAVIRGKTPEKPYLSQLLNSTIDVDQLDYILRDAYYTGVAYGMIDIERFLQTLTISDNNMTVLRKGIGVVENILMARQLMYSSVYFHKTVRIAELMLSKAIEMISDAEPFEFFKMTDAELINELKRKGIFQNEIVARLKYRNLFKQAYSASISDLDQEYIDIIKRLEDINRRKEKEQEIEEFFNIPPGHVIIDIPYQMLHQAEPRIDETNIQVANGDEIKTLDDFTPIAKAIRTRNIPDWIIMLITDNKYRDLVSENAEKILFK